MIDADDREDPTEQGEEELQPRAWGRYVRRAAIVLGVGGAVVVVAAVLYGVVLFVFEPEGMAGAERAAAFKCLSRGERAYIRELRRIAAERREHLDAVQVYMGELDEDRKVGLDPAWRQGLYGDMAKFTASSRAMAQVDGPASTREIQRNLGAMSELATSFARLYIQGVRADERAYISKAKLTLRDAQLRMLRTQTMGRELCD